MEVITRLEPSQKGADCTESAMRLVGTLMYSARRSVRDEHIEESPVPQAVDEK
jgi:hypothetical protein